jgi:hypothetical protein
MARLVSGGLFVVAALLALAACSTAATGTGEPSTVATTTVDTTEPPVTAATTTAETTTTVAAPFPAGYPQVVAVSSLPFQVRSWYTTSGMTQAVAVAPGVWAPLPPGADPQTAATAGVLDGFCASVKAYERQYLGGQQEGGACW